MENLRKDKWHGQLYREEIALAREVFGDTLPYERIFISNTKTQTQGITLATSPRRTRAKYLLLWSGAYQQNIAEADNHMKQTFIHELVHVWQSQHAGLTAMTYMRQSLWHQFSKGLGDVYKEGFFRGTGRMFEIMGRDFTREWGKHRNRAYAFEPNDIGHDLAFFNVEQQALIIESWFAKESFKLCGIEYLPGHQSATDPRFPYIRDCLRTGDPHAKYS